MLVKNGERSCTSWCDCENYAISDRNSWKDICHAYETNISLLQSLTRLLFIAKALVYMTVFLLMGA